MGRKILWLHIHPALTRQVPFCKRQMSPKGEGFFAFGRGLTSRRLPRYPQRGVGYGLPAYTCLVPCSGQIAAAVRLTASRPAGPVQAFFSVISPTALPIPNTSIPSLGARCVHDAYQIPTQICLLDTMSLLQNESSSFPSERLGSDRQPTVNKQYR
ncbi:uncharacterized protein WM277_013589 isoform 2-T2 [Molossus nigricans]